MANLSAILGGGGVKSITQFEVSSPVDDGTYQNVDITSAGVTNTAKTSINVTCVPSIENGTVAFRLNSTTIAQYKITNVSVPPGFLTFEVIEYN